MKRIIPLLLCLSMTGCFSFIRKDSKGRQLPDKGKIETEQKMQEKKTIVTDLEITVDPYLEPRVNERPPIELDIMGEKIKLPPNAKLRMTIKSNRKKQESDWYSLVGTFNLSNKQSALIVMGALCIAAGVVLCFFGLWKMGAAAAAFGLALITCGILVEKFPWVFLIVFFMVLGGVGFVLYEIITKQKKQLTLSKVAGQIDRLKVMAPDLVKKYITDPLAKDPNAKTILKHVRSVRDI